MIDASRFEEAGEHVAFDEARQLVLEGAHPLPGEMVALGDSFGRISAQPLYADDDIIPFARSAMDGYAVRACDTEAAASHPLTLRVHGAAYAGDRPVTLGAGTATAIATGAALPDGADAVVPVEDTSRAHTGVVLFAAVQSGDHVFLPGDDAKRGELLMRRGDRITPGRSALLAAAGYAHVTVRRRPRVAVVCTGDELVEVSVRPARGQIRNSNATMLAAQLRSDGADVVSTETVPDRSAPMRAAFERALASCDVIVTTGGASVGERDLVKSTLVALGARFAFTSVGMRPAKPSAFAQTGSTRIIVLPGNPAAAFIGYATLVRGLIRRLSGEAVAIPPALPAKLCGTIHGKAERHFVVFGSVGRRGAAFAVRPIENQCSSLVRTSAEANGLIIVPPTSAQFGDGATVDVEMLDWNALEPETP